MAKQWSDVRHLEIPGLIMAKQRFDGILFDKSYKSVESGRIFFVYFFQIFQRNTLSPCQTWWLFLYWILASTKVWHSRKLPCLRIPDEQTTFLYFLVFPWGFFQHKLSRGIFKLFCSLLRRYIFSMQTNMATRGVQVLHEKCALCCHKSKR